MSSMLIRDYERRYSDVVYVQDHLGSTRTKVKDRKTIIGEYDYLPYGELTSYSTVGYANDFLYGGKELEAGYNVLWYDSGARYQTTHGIFSSQDPLAEKYYSISPYAYCAGNPVNLTDYSGKEVIPHGSTELDMIRNTWPEDARKYVQFDKNGKVDRVLLSQYSGESQNFKSLMELVNSNKVISVILDDKFSFKGKNGQLGTAHMSYFPFDEKRNI